MCVCRNSQTTVTIDAQPGAVSMTRTYLDILELIYLQSSATEYAESVAMEKTQGKAIVLVGIKVSSRFIRPIATRESSLVPFLR